MVAFWLTIWHIDEDGEKVPESPQTQRCIPIFAKSRESAEEMCEQYASTSVSAKELPWGDWCMPICTGYHGFKLEPCLRVLTPGESPDSRVDVA